MPLISADDVGVQFNTQFDFKRPCLNNGTFCSTSAVCNITVTYPDGELMFNNRVMNNKGSFHNITLTQVINRELGFHPFIMSCQDGSVFGGDTGNLVITADGKPPQIFPTQFMIAIFAMAFIGAGLFSERLRLFKHMGSIVLMIFGIVTLYPGYSFINWSTLLGKGLGFASIALGVYFFIEDSFSRDEQEEGLTSPPKDFFNDNDGRFHQ